MWLDGKIGLFLAVFAMTLVACDKKIPKEYKPVIEVYLPKAIALAEASTQLCDMETPPITSHPAKDTDFLQDERVLDVKVGCYEQHQGKPSFRLLFSDDPVLGESLKANNLPAGTFPKTRYALHGKPYDQPDAVWFDIVDCPVEHSMLFVNRPSADGWVQVILTLHGNR